MPGNKHEHKMYKNSNKYNDIISKFQYLHPLEKPQVWEGSVNTTHNLLIKNNNYLTPLYFSMMSLFLQKPTVKVASKSHASFKLRQNMPIGTKTTFHGDMLEDFRKKSLFTILPNIELEKLKITKTSKKSDNLLKCQVLFGLDNWQFLNELFEVKVPGIQLGGGNLQFKVKSRSNKMLCNSLSKDEVYNHHLFFISTLGFVNNHGKSVKG